MKTHRRAPLAARLLAVPLVALAVLVGIWVTGGVLTNDFALAMALTAVWMGVAGLACAAVAWRRPELRLPVLGTYLLVAAAVGVYLGRSQFVDDVVNERVVSVSPPVTEEAEEATPPRNVLVAQGSFEPVAHSARGTARVIRTPSRRVLTLTGFEVDNGPDLRVYVVAGPARTEEEVDQFADLGALKGNKGNQQYDLPRKIDLGRSHTVVIWCRAFSVNFARAPLS
jgi:Electron transfer DM13